MRSQATFVLSAIVMMTGCAHVARPAPDVILDDERLVITDAVLQDAPSSEASVVAPRERFRGHWGAVLPMGTRVDVLHDRLDRRLPWTHVRVVASPIAAQNAWEGWVRTDALHPTESSQRSLGHALLERSTRVCPESDSDAVACQHAVDERQALRVVRCEGEHAVVELWSARGYYLAGAIERRQFRADPCPAVSLRSTHGSLFDQ